MRVVFCVGSLRIGGTELNAVRTAERLDRSRFDLSVVSLQQSGPLLSRYRDAGIPVQTVPIRSFRYPSTWRQCALLAGQLRDGHVSVLHAHDFYSNIFGVVASRLARVPVVIASRRWWASESRPGKDSWPRRLATRTVFRLAHQIVVNGPGLKGLTSKEDGVPEHRILVLPNFVDPVAFEPTDPRDVADLRRELEVPEDAQVVGIVANLRPIKDHASLLRAVAILARRGRDVCLVLVGDGERRQLIERLASELGIAHRMRFAGTRGDALRFYRMFDVAVLCSLAEGFPNSVVEAMATGTPVVATAVGGNCDAVVDGECGFLVPPSDPDRLAAALERLLIDEQLRAEIGQRARRRAQDHHDAGRTLAHLEEAYEQLLAHRGYRRATRGN